MKHTKPLLKKEDTSLPAESFDPVEDIVNAALIGGNAMSNMEPFGAIVGAAIGVIEDEASLAKPKKLPPQTSPQPKG